MNLFTPHASLGWNLGGMERWPHLTMKRAYHIELPTEKYQNKINRVANSLDIRISEYLEKRWLFLGWILYHLHVKHYISIKNSINFQKICEVWKRIFPQLTNHKFLAQKCKNGAWNKTTPEMVVVTFLHFWPFLLTCGILQLPISPLSKKLVQAWKDCVLSSNLGPTASF